ncbi:VOC family protein [Dactylosporangium fulvum]|uniref:VOC family protein n=1 Tax=Dactylosporangium fulvum TaxID=53359 RepID=A0ABY5W5A0_9ACTN|nr:VOC family protein [Dactylosporangium fulvum]UWP84570.1 VOC family protein [Dactylosporangium fulvum]
MTDTLKLRGLANVSYWAADWKAAKDWYGELIGFEPYFLRDGYAEWRLGDDLDELGLIDSRYRPAGMASGPGGAVLYWHVDDVHGMFARLLAMGATEHEPPQDRGSGFVTATVVDPFGNLLGVMYNPHYAEIQAARG